jgi:hypothetical protein
MRPYLKYIFAALTAVIIFGIYLYNKPHKNVSASKPEYSMSAAALFNAYEENEAESDAKYGGQVIEVRGKVREATQDDEGALNITLDTGNDFFGIICEFQPKSKQRREDFQAGQEVVLKGLCTGMMMDVVLVRCVRVQ